MPSGTKRQDTNDERNRSHAALASRVLIGGQSLFVEGGKEAVVELRFAVNSEPSITETTIRLKATGEMFDQNVSHLSLLENHIYQNLVGTNKTLQP
jgi:hypothetical protein